MIKLNLKQRDMKKIICLSIILILSVGKLLFAGGSEKDALNKKDEVYTTVNGKLIDEETKDPVVFASITVIGTSIGTVSNSDGEFVLKVPASISNAKLVITYLGYANKTISLVDLSQDEMATIKLSRNVIPLDAVVVRSEDPISLLKKAISKFEENYSNFPEMQTGFYRETIKQNRNYVAISEAVLDIYKSGYNRGFDNDRLKIYKGRKSRDVKRMDTIMLKFQGGPRTSLLLDVVKTPGDILDEVMFPYYKYETAGMININDRETYVIKFKQTTSVNYPLYDGKIYIDAETFAVAGLDFRISDHGLEFAPALLIKKKPLSLKMDVVSGNYLVNYKMLNGKWYLNYVRSELVLKAKWDKKLFKSTYTAMLEMAVTDRDTENVEKFAYKEVAKLTDILADQVEDFEDHDFWGDYNYIKPDESIEVAIEKLSKKLKRSQR